MKKFELLAASAIALAFANPAFAQTTPPAGSPTQQDTGNPTDQTGSTPETDNANNDIIVTASKREATLLDTPISVSVTSGETIQQAQIRDLIDLQTVVPSLRIAQNQTSANSTFIIRGFGNGSNNPGIEPAVGVFIDGVYRSRAAAQIADLPNLKRVEVLRGPQSTLFGKNASAGIISVVTAEPSFDFGGSVEATYGNYNAAVIKGDITGPISDTLAFSLAGNYNRRDGYLYDRGINQDVNNRNRYGVRGQLLFQPSADLKFRLIGDYDKIDEHCCGAINLVNGPTGAIVRALGGNLLPADSFSGIVYNNLLSSNDIKNYGVSLQADYNVTQELALTSISSYRAVRLRTNQDSDFTSADLIGKNANQLDIDTYTQEVRLASNFDGKFNFLLGGFYFNEKIMNADQITFGTAFRGYANALAGGAIPSVEAALGFPAGTFQRPGDGLFDSFNYRDESYSVFGQADFELLDGLTFTAGVNYTNDKKKVSSNVTDTDVFSQIDFVAAGSQLVRNGAIATNVGTAIGLGAGAQASPAQIAGFATAQPAIYANIVAGSTAFANANANNPAVNPLLALRPFQFLPGFLNFPNAVEDGKTADDNLSYTFRLSYKANDHISAYLTYASGFKASSWNLTRDSRPFAADFIAGSPVTNPPASRIRTAISPLPANLTSGSRYARPEKSRVVEAGLKGQFPNFAFNLAIFQQEITDFQSNVFTGTGFILANAPKESVNGVEFDTSYTPVQNLNLSLAITYLDPLYDDFPGGSTLLPGTLTVGPANQTGRRPDGIPEVSLSVGGSYKHQVSDDLALLFRADYNWDSSVRIAEGAIPLERQVQSLNASISGQLANGLELSVWGRNITDHRYITQIFPAVAQTGSLSGYPNQPRTYGATARFKF